MKIRPQSEARLTQYREILRKCKPTPAQLAQVAAPLLAHNGGDYRDAIVEAALLLWQCEVELRAASDPAFSVLDRVAANPWGVEIPKPGKFPVTLDELLRLVMPQVDKTADRLARCRKYLRDDLQLNLGAVGEWIADARKRHFDENDYLEVASEFLAWAKRDKSDQRRNAAKQRVARGNGALEQKRRPNKRRKGLDSPKKS